MKYNVFISYTKADSLLAKEINDFIKEAFRGEIIPWLAGEEIKSGDKWKEEIKNNLDKCRAIISIITPNSKNKPWLFIEWGAFWIADKESHILMSEELSEADLIHPMQDLQYVTLTNKEALDGFVQRLSAASGYRPAPYDKTEELIVLIKAALQQQQKDLYEKSFAKYEDSKVPLPESDDEMQMISEYFIINKNEVAFKRVFNKIKADGVKYKLIRQLINTCQFELAISSTLEIRSAETQTELILLLMEYYGDEKRLYNLIEAVGKKSQPQLRVIMIELIDQGKDEAEIFAKVLSYADNTPALHKVASHLIENSKLDSKTFNDVTIKILDKNRAEARKLGEELIDNSLEETKQFDYIVKEMAKHNQKETAKLLLYLKKSNPSLFEKYKVSGIITNEAAKKQMDDELDG